MRPAVVRLLVAILIAPGALRAQSPIEEVAAGQVIETLPNGGVIELQRAPDDSVGIRAVRVQLRAIAQAFTLGDLSSPVFAHLVSAPGAQVMADRRNVIRFDYRDLSRGAALRISSTDAGARKAIWDFVTFQRNEHLADP